MTVFNFSAGPAVLPAPVLERAQNELANYAATGVSVMEMSHRSAEFMDIAERAEASLRRLLGINDDYSVLFMSGGATMQFAMAPINLSAPDDTVAIVNTGQWSTKAVKEGQRFANVHVAASSEADGFCSVPDFDSWDVPASAAYLHYTPNETIGGVEFHSIPDVAGDIPLVADMSSTILSRPVDVSRFGMIYAGAQKNIGPAGITIGIVRKDLLDRAREDAPSLFKYKSYADSGSMINTPPTYPWYMAGLVFDWLEERGGVAAMAKINEAKAARLYAAIDDSGGFYANPVAKNARSWMNVPFTIADDALTPVFLTESADAGLVQLKGHRSVGGMRASIYNAMPEEGVDALIGFMSDFRARHG